ncbi:MAG TPA: LysM peptidoglycan-binding domain-containing protein [Myxococcales bacterium]|jgi:nucleoid-associated protein YgaU|nr:LysM peptidoglycan-binding domain-containing protein [Myxococcales bacterium]
MSLIADYSDVLETAKRVGIEVADTKEQNGKLVLTGKAQYAFDRDRLWDQIKTHANWQNEVAVMLDVAHAEPYGVYKVKSGETLSGISKSIYGELKHYKEIFEINKDVLKDPDHVKAGQELKLPDKAKILATHH